MTDQNLYQIIGVSETASPQEIENAAATKYNEARNLVNHHSPEIANNANQVLTLVERARSVLLNPQKKADYDISLGLVSTMGGLADPTQAGKMTSFAAQPIPQVLNRPQQQIQPQQTQQAMDQLMALNAWICEKCNTPNTKGTKFCKKCGHTVGIVCPNCGRLIEASAERCTECGVAIKEVMKQSEMEKEAKAIQLQQQIKMQPMLIQMQKQSISALSMSSFWWIFLTWIGVIVWIAAYSKAVGVLNTEGIDTPAAMMFRQNATRARTKAKGNLVFAVLLIIFIVIISLINSGY